MSSHDLLHSSIEEADPKLAALLVQEEERQAKTLSFIASENYAPEAVLEASRSVLTNKYSEGYPGKRYYEGQQLVDPIESLAQERACSLFNMAHANVQPYSGSPANLAIYLAILQPGEKVMGMSLPMGGHLTHGWKASVTGKWFQGVQYGLDMATGIVDMDEVRELALKERPKLIFCGGTAIPRTIDFEAFSAIADEVEATLVADIAHISGLIAGGAHPSPAGHADIVSTTTHKTLRGPRGAMLLTTDPLAKKVDSAVFPGLQGGPHNHTTAAIAAALHLASQPDFRVYAASIVANSKALAESLLDRGYDLVSGGTDNHLILIDFRNIGLGGKVIAQTLDKVGLTTNYNAVPGDERPPFDPSGLRIGTAAVTTRGLTPADMPQIASWMDKVIKAVKDERFDQLGTIKEEVEELALSKPVPGVSVS